MYQQATVWNEKNEKVAQDQWNFQVDPPARITEIKLSRTGLSTLTNYPTLLLQDRTNPLTIFEMPTDPDEKCQIPAGDWCALRMRGHEKRYTGAQKPNFLEYWGQRLF